jgi:hypothetical protein
MLTTAIFNGILALGVIAMVVAPLVWAVLTQHHDHRGTVAATGPTAQTETGQQGRRTGPRDRRGAPQPSYQPLAGRA